MIEVDQPQVFLVGRPMIDARAMSGYLREVGGEAWWERVGQFTNPAGTVPAAEGLIEFAGRLCYRSWEPGLNRNVTKIREDRGDYLLNVLRSGHGSVLEHAVFNFALHDVSRVLTAELNRHRAGVAISEQSLRYVRLDELRFRLPPTLPDEILAEGRKLVEQIEGFMAWAIESCGLDNEGDEADLKLSFAEKKTITSALRRFAPLGLATEELWSANVRAIRHVISMRSDAAAEEEIRVFADDLAQIMQVECPLLFGDYTPALDVDPPAWSTPYEKV